MHIRVAQREKRDKINKENAKDAMIND